MDRVATTLIFQPGWPGHARGLLLNMDQTAKTTQTEDSADRRTRLAEDRTVLAAERTYAAWLRTGLAFLAAGLAAERLLGRMMETWQLRALTAVLILCGILCFAAAGWRDMKVRGQLPSPDISLLPRAITMGLAILLAAVSIPAIFLVWFGHP